MWIATYLSDLGADVPPKGLPLERGAIQRRVRHLNEVLHPWIGLSRNEGRRWAGSALDRVVGVASFGRLRGRRLIQRLLDREKALVTGSGRGGGPCVPRVPMMWGQRRTSGEGMRAGNGSGSRRTSGEGE
jgi:hypothetical protein